MSLLISVSAGINLATVPLRTNLASVELIKLTLSSRAKLLLLTDSKPLLPIMFKSVSKGMLLFSMRSSLMLSFSSRTLMNSSVLLENEPILMFSRAIDWRRLGFPWIKSIF